MFRTHLCKARWDTTGGSLDRKSRNRGTDTQVALPARLSLVTIARTKLVLNFPARRIYKPNFEVGHAGAITCVWFPTPWRTRPVNHSVTHLLLPSTRVVRNLLSWNFSCSSSVDIGTAEPRAPKAPDLRCPILPTALQMDTRARQTGCITLENAQV